MADGCIWCDLDGRSGCPVHYRRGPLLVGIIALAFTAAVLVILLVTVGAIR